MKYVLDASVALKWVLPEPLAAKARQLRDDYENGMHVLIAPDVFPVEAAHALVRCERRKIINVGQAAPLFVNILSVAPMSHPCMPLITRAIDFASQFLCGVYDCLYIALAEREGCEFVTADDKLVNKVQPTFPFVIALAALP